MATATFPFFPTTVVPPPPCGCGAPAYAPCRFSTATTYPPPADAYTPTSGFSPNWPSWPPPSPGPAPSTTPPTFPSFPTPNTAYHHHHSFQLPPPSHPNPHWHQGMQQMQPPPPAPGNPWHPHHTAAQAPSPSSPPPRRPSPSSPPPLAASMAAVAPAWPFPSASVPAVQEGAAPSTSSSGRARRPSSKPSTRQPPTTSPQSPRSGASSLLELPDLSLPTCQHKKADGKTQKESSMTARYSSALWIEKNSRDAHRVSPDLIYQQGDCTKGDDASGASNSHEKFVRKQTDPGILSISLVPDHNVATPEATTAPTSRPPRGIALSPATTSSTPLFGFTELSGSKMSTSTTTCLFLSAPLRYSAATASVAPQMFGEMPTPLSEYENYCCGNPNAIQSSCVGTLYEQNLGPVFDCYDDDMNGCSTEFVDVFLGTPEQQKSDQFANCFREASPNTLSEDTPERVSHAYDVDTKGRTDELVYVFASPPDQQPYEAKQQDSEQLLKCIGKATENEQTIACLNYISGVPDYTLEQQQNDDKKTPVNLQQLRPTVVSIFSFGTDQKHDTKLCVKYGKAQVSNQQMNTQRTEAAIKEWDPGIFGAASSAASKQDLSSVFTSRAQQAAEDMALRQASAPTQTKEAARDKLAGEIVQIQSRLRQQEYSIQYIQGEVANLSKKVAQIGSSLGMHIHDGNIASQASGFGTQRAMQFSEIPQHYGFDNLKRQSVFLADGSEHSFYALPDNYPLKQLTSPMSPSAAEHVDVTSEPFVAEQAAVLAPVHCSQINNTTGSVSLLVSNLQLPMNVQDAPHVFKETPIYDIYEEQDSACLDITSDVRDFPLELQQQDGERACNCPVLKASDSLVTRSSQLSVDYSMSKLRLLWDPGIMSLMDMLLGTTVEPHQVGSALLLQFLFTGRKDMVTKGTSTSPLTLLSKDEKFLKKLVYPLVTNGLKQGGMSGNGISM